MKEYEMDVNSHLAAPDGIEATRKLTDAEDIWDYDSSPREIES